MSTVIPDISPTELLDRFRGQVTRARPGYPEVIHLRIRDDGGAEWRFSTFDATFSPQDPDVLLGRTVVSAELAPSGRLRIGFADGFEFVVSPMPLEPEEWDDNLENWTLLTPDGLYLAYGPGDRWHLGLATDVG